MQIKCHDHRSRGSGDIRPDKHQANNFTIFPLHYAKLCYVNYDYRYAFGRFT